jgi:8-oxo-dGTP diphosphatase
MDNKQVLVGVGVIVIRDGKVLLGQRKGSHGAGTWALPGGHLEFGEEVADCAARELLEETGLVVGQMTAAPYVSTLFAEEGKHYITLFVTAHSRHGEPALCEPEKCSQWRWCDWSALPQPLFAPLSALHANGYVPVPAR